MSIDMERVAEVQRMIIALGLLVTIPLLMYRCVKWALFKVSAFRDFTTAWNARVAEKDFADTLVALRRLDLSNIPLDPLREAGKKNAAFVHTRYQIYMFLFAFGASDLFKSAIDSIDKQRVVGSMSKSALALALVVLPLLVWQARRSPGVARYRFLLSIMSAIEACEAVMSSQPDDRHKKLRRLDDACATVRRSILKVHLIAASTGRSSPRRKRAKQHAALVVAKLQIAEAEIDRKGDGALRGLAALLVKIGNNYAVGNVGNLLPDQTLRGVAAAPNREGLRMTGVIIATGSGLCASALMGFPEIAIAVTTAISALFACMVIYGPRSAVAKSQELLGVIWR
ncbi:hypothetical protein ACIQUO_15110 [Streptomyces albogriseolus]|uniref:hypothetical protein n=1 Tax=Streptomyces albogriseolus TaxID=1887 RepID=UPI00381DFC92